MNNTFAYTPETFANLKAAGMTTQDYDTVVSTWSAGWQLQKDILSALAVTAAPLQYYKDAFLPIPSHLVKLDKLVTQASDISVTPRTAKRGDIFPVAAWLKQQDKGRKLLAALIEAGQG